MNKKLSNQLWRNYNRPYVPRPWAFGGNFPWDEAAFLARMLLGVACGSGLNAALLA